MTLRLSLLLLPLLAGCPSTPVADDAPDPTDDVPGADAQSDAPDPAEPCTTVGETRVGPCGRMCGQASQRCSETHVWENTSACLMEGECPRGTSEMRSVGMCGEETRLCQNDCTWTAWERSRPDGGECRPGQLRFTVDEARCGAGRGTYEVCSDACTFGPGSGTCTDGCDDSARTEPEWAREVCVPAGTFIRGDDDSRPDDGFSPEAEVYLSAFYIDVFPVTNGRYRPCVDAPHCDEVAFERFNLLRDNNPVEPTRLDIAESFCSWDGRRLLTDAEWEKAIRGPAPRNNDYPWDGTEPSRCDLLQSYACGYADPSTRYVNDDPYDGLPATRGFFGTFLQYAGGLEWVSDWYAADYYARPESTLPDPTGPSSGTVHVVRGAPPRYDGYPLSLRQPELPFETLAGFRCARSVEVTP